jgi:hypothetical protein
VADIYKEVDLTSEEYKVSGHPDFYLVVGGKLYPMEIKSMGNSASANSRGQGFDTLEKAQADHCLQVSSYHRMSVQTAKDIGVDLAPTCILTYVSKDFNERKAPFPYKEYHVNPFTYKPQVTAIFDEGKAIHAGVSGVLPPRLGVCTKPTDKTPSKCSTCVACFTSETGFDARGKTFVKPAPPPPKPRE